MVVFGVGFPEFLSSLESHWLMNEGLLASWHFAACV